MKISETTENVSKSKENSNLASPLPPPASNAIKIWLLLLGGGTNYDLKGSQ